MARIELTDTIQDMAVKMCDGNPGALAVIMQCLDKAAAIDPDSFLGGLGPVLSMDTLNIYGSRIWMLFKDVCHQNLHDMIAVIRANQLGFLRESDLHHAIDNYGEGIDVAELVAKVQERLPNFKRGE